MIDLASLHERIVEAGRLAGEAGARCGRAPASPSMSRWLRWRSERARSSRDSANGEGGAIETTETTSAVPDRETEAVTELPDQIRETLEQLDERHRGYGRRPLPDPLDDAIAQVIDFTVEALPDERAQLKSLIQGTQAWFLLAYGERMASLALRESSLELVSSGLTSVALAAEQLYYKEVLVVLAPLYRAAERLGGRRASAVRSGLRPSRDSGGLTTSASFLSAPIVIESSSSWATRSTRPRTAACSCGRGSQPVGHFATVRPSLACVVEKAPETVRGRTEHRRRSGRSTSAPGLDPRAPHYPQPLRRDPSSRARSRRPRSAVMRNRGLGSKVRAHRARRKAAS